MGPSRSFAYVNTAEGHHTVPVAFPLAILGSLRAAGQVELGTVTGRIEKQTSRRFSSLYVNAVSF
jgi:hypothetical protein